MEKVENATLYGEMNNRDWQIYGLDAIPTELLTEELQRRCVPAPYSLNDYEIASAEGLDLNHWADYVKYFQIGEEDEEL